MSSRRQERLAEEIKRGLSALFFEGLKDPGIDPRAVSITRVDVSRDLSYARVHVSVLGDEKKCRDTMAALERARGFIRSVLAGELNLRHAPEIVFRWTSLSSTGFGLRQF